MAELEGSGHGPPLQTPGETPYQTPSTSTSRLSSRPSTARESRAPSSSPPRMPDDAQRRSQNLSADDGISILDPRRFTPTLHANLVSEILSLRRELDSKHKFIEDLEINYQTTKDENDSLTRKLAQSNKDTRSAKRQIQQLEHGTLAALEELAKDRNEKAQTCEELKVKLEKLEKKVKSQDEDASRTQMLWDREREKFETQKRTLERRAHVSEARLKGLLTELAEQQVAQEQRHAPESEDEETRDSGLGNDSDTNSVRSSGPRHTPSRKTRHMRDLSSVSQRSLHRAYRISAQSDMGGKTNGLSLADELDLDEEEDEGLEEIDEQGEEDLFGPGLHRDQTQSTMAKDQDSFPAAAKTLQEVTPTRSATYVDRAVQYSRPSSRDADPFDDEPRTFFDDTTSVPGSVTHSRIQSMEGVPQTRVQSMVWSINNRAQSVASTFDSRSETPQPLDANAMTIQQLENPTVVMVSSGAQTAEEPPSPPATPKVSQEVEAVSLDQPQPEQEPKQPVHMVTVSTQTDSPEKSTTLGAPGQSLKRPNRPDLIAVPSITIVPPASAPNSPRETILPPGTKNISTQTLIDDLVSVRSIAMQTDEIRVDQRLMKLAPHLRPSAIRSSPNSPAQVVRQKESQQSMTTVESADGIIGPSATPKQLSEKALGKAPILKAKNSFSATMLLSDSETETEARQLGEKGLPQKGRQSLRNGNLFTGYEGEKENDKHGEADDEKADDTQQQSSLSTSGTSRRSLRDLRDGRAYPKPPTPVPEEKEIVSRASTESVRQRAHAGRHQARNSIENARISKRQPSMRRSALIKGGSTVHSQRSRSPSLQSAESSNQSTSQGGAGAPPPFPIPNRLSSRKLMPTGSKSDGASSSPTPRASGLSYFARRNQKGQHIARNESLRKVKSAAVIPRRSGEESRSKSPPAPSRNSGPPPMPQDVVTRPQYAYAPQQAQSAVQTPVTTTDNVSDSGQPTVVDAIAATMVGEWMWKYVRRRKSFSVAESADDFSRNGRDVGSGIRHKRWVWISPYERSVMWSSKQPASGSALLGKSGRKLVIQSVLDVKDDTPVPRGSSIQPSFNRSILILTPARALKFTAVSQERHYLWLTALSFLAHSGVGAPELAAVPPIPHGEPEPAAVNTTFSRRAHIRDSVLMGKEKKRPSALSSLTSSRDSSSKKGASFAGPIIQTEALFSDAADAPTIPRYTYNTHGRKRSNTGPRIPPAPSALRNFTAPAIPPYPSYSISSGPSHINTNSIDSDCRTHHMGAFGGGPSQPASLYGSNSTGGVSGRMSEATSASARTPISPQFEDFGTRRMEAFVAPRRPSIDAGSAFSSANGSGIAGKGRSGVSAAGRARGNTQWTTNITADPRRAPMLVTGEFESFDPFRGF